MMYNGIREQDSDEHLPERNTKRDIGKAISQDWSAGCRAGAPCG